MSRGDLTDRQVQGAGQRAADVLVRAGLPLAGPEPPRDRRRTELVEQHRLADSAQAGEHQRPFRAPGADPFEEYVEGGELIVATSEFGWPLAGTRGVRVTDRVHVENCIGSSTQNPRSG